MLLYSLAAIKTDMNGKIYGALQFGCYLYRYECKGLWCSSTVRLHYINTDISE